MVSVSASVNLPLHHKVQKFSSGTGSPGWSRKKGHGGAISILMDISRWTWVGWFLTGFQLFQDQMSGVKWHRFLWAGCPFSNPTNTAKALKETVSNISNHEKIICWPNLFFIHQGTSDRRGISMAAFNDSTLYYYTASQYYVRRSGLLLQTE